MRSKSILCACFIALLLCGCTAPKVYLRPSNPHAAQDEALSWHQIRFKWHWPGNQEPEWSLDLLAADRIFSGIIDRYQGSLPLWRFHRRAARDPAGFQFSFIFYSSDATAREIETDVTGHPITRALLDHGLLERVYTTHPKNPSKLSATSDPIWPKDIQKAWPMFIMGASQTWLALVQIHAREGPAPGNDIDKMRQHYAKVNDEIDKEWQEYAQHAFFHHLSAIFGYEPMVLRKYLLF